MAQAKGQVRPAVLMQLDHVSDLLLQAFANGREYSMIQVGYCTTQEGREGRCNTELRIPHVGGGRALGLLQMCTTLQDATQEENPSEKVVIPFFFSPGTFAGGLVNARDFKRA